LLKPNRKLQAWLILLPLILTKLLLFSLRYIDYDLKEFYELWIFAVALTSFWLISPFLSKRNRFIIFLVAVLNFVVVVLIRFLDMRMFEEYKLDFFGFYVIMFSFGYIMVLLGFITAGLFCRKKFTKLRFMISAIVSYSIMAIVITRLFYTDERSFYFDFHAIWVTFSKAIFLMLLPYILFILFVFYIPIYQQRFYDIFRLKGMESHTIP